MQKRVYWVDVVNLAVWMGHINRGGGLKENIVAHLKHPRQIVKLLQSPLGHLYRSVDSSFSHMMHWRAISSCSVRLLA